MNFKTKLRASTLLCALLFLFLPFAPTHAALASTAADGGIAGTVTDPKGAVVTGASVTVADMTSVARRAEVVSDAQGRFKIESLPAGVYVVTVTAKGFGDARREGSSRSKTCWPSTSRTTRSDERPKQ